MSPHGPFLLRVTAGTDTSRITLSIMIGLVVEHPEVQKKLHQELDDVLGKIELNFQNLLFFLKAFQFFTVHLTHVRSCTCTCIYM